MGDTTGSASEHRGTVLGEELTTGQELVWTGVEALLQANDAERRAIEEYLHLMRENFEEPIDSRDVNGLIDAAIRNHERAIDDLELAKEAVGELDS